MGVTSDLGSHDQSQVAGIINPGQVIFPTPDNGLFRPIEVPRERRLNHAESSVFHLLVPFASAGGEHVILPAVQLLTIILKTAIVILLLGITLWGRLLKYALRVVPLLIVNLVLPGIRL